MHWHGGKESERRREKEQNGSEESKRVEKEREREEERESEGKRERNLKDEVELLVTPLNFPPPHCRLSGTIAQCASPTQHLQYISFCPALLFWLIIFIASLSNFCSLFSVAFIRFACFLIK